MRYFYKNVIYLLVYVCLPVSAEIYKWVDTNGTAHYSDVKAGNTEVVEEHEANVITPAQSDPHQYSFQTRQDDSKIQITPVKIRQAFLEMGQSEDIANVFTDKMYLKEKADAAKAGISLDSYYSSYKVDGYNSATKQFYSLFHNTARSPTCARDYLIQRVKITNSYIDKSGNSKTDSTKYLVEILKLNNEKNMKGVDQHVRSYSQGGFAARKASVEIQLGCGKVNGLFDGKAWPYSPNTLYKMLQDYSEQAKIYNRVNFDFYRTYIYEVTLYNDGRYTVLWPDFLRE